MCLLSIWWEWAQSLGSWILFSCMFVGGKKGLAEEEVVEEKSLETFAVTFNPRICFAVKLKSTRRKNTQDQHAAGKLVFHVASSCDVQWHVMSNRTYQYSTLKISPSEQGSQFWQCQLTKVSEVMRQHGHWHRFRPHGRKPCSCRWQACHFARKHADVSLGEIESCTCCSVSVFVTN